MSDDDQENVEHDDHDPSFKPIVELPAVTIPTCEENEDILYVNEHTRLYRFVKPVLSASGDSPNASASGDANGEWKERGTGELKLLRNRTSLRCRIVMRREKTLKVCANHFLTSEMQFDRLLGTLSAHTCLWFTPADFADGESHPERFCLRFRTADEANDFRQAVERAKTKRTPAEHQSETNTDSHSHKTPGEGEKANTKHANSDTSETKHVQEQDKRSDELADRLSTLTVAKDKESA